MDWGQLVGQREPFDLDKLIQNAQVMAQRFQPCRVQQSVQGLRTDLSTERQQRFRAAIHGQKRDAIVHKA
ncbi:hypothetical protein AB688_25145 [Pseudomonas putida]|uniref:Uncharacterized protein n=1 Tax=Pseudomonas putida TaxID=303 RepID=A0AAD0PGW5_PSEPU|nr:hypothetical protein AB688_25145 [Pseudomonas putida]AXA26978.1 hypothetical protein C1S65_23735 [Pseudomonas putida]